MNLNQVVEYLPDLYDGIVETSELMSSEQKLFDTFNLEGTKLENNQYINTLSLEGISDFEQNLEIVADPEVESLSFRRARIKNRLTNVPPFTRHFLYVKLCNIIGIGKFNMNVDYSNRTLYVESSAENQQWFVETYITVNTLKPANMVFVNKPLIVDGVLVSEQIEQIETTYNYNLGSTWILGSKPFSTSENKGVIKMATVSSINNTFLSEIANSTSNINKVRLNNTYIVTADKITRVITGNVADIQYSIKPSDGLESVTKIEFLDSTDNVLTTSNVYVPILADTTFKHTINFKEG